MGSIWMLSLQFILFTLIGSVILKHWFKTGVAHRAPRVRHAGYKQTGPGAHRDVFFLNILPFCSVSCELVPIFSRMLEEALCVPEQKHTGCWGKRCRGRAARHVRFLCCFPHCFAKWYSAAKKTITSVSLQKLQFRSWANLMDSVY